MKPVCIFCGNPPQNKNREHIFPQWLLKMTGFDQKKASVGTNWKTGEEIVFNTLSYTLPSCTECNSSFGLVESKVKHIVESITNDQEVSGAQLELLLDWFDKVRLGAWFGVKYMNKDVFAMSPKFYLNSRVGIKDRFLSITNTYSKEKTLNWSGVNTPAFMLSPTAFSLRVNNLVFVNCSSDFVVSRQLGFPYGDMERPSPTSEKTDWIMNAGTKLAVPKFFSTRLYSPAFVVAQALYDKASGNKFAESLYESDYVLDNSYDAEKGVGKIYLSDYKNIQTLERSEMANFSMPEAKRLYGHIEVVRPILQLQIELIKSRKRDLSRLSAQQSAREIEGNQAVVGYLEEQIRQYRY